MQGHKFLGNSNKPDLSNKSDDMQTFQKQLHIPNYIHIATRFISRFTTNQKGVL